MEPSDPIRAYIERLLALRDASLSGPTPEALAAVARELGLTPADLARLEDEAADHLARGLGFLEHRLYADAVRELTEALALRPLHFETQHALARAHGALAGKSQRSRAEAERLARVCLSIEPSHQPSFEVLRLLARGAMIRRALRVSLVLGGLGLLIGVVVALTSGPERAPEAASPGRSLASPLPASVASAAESGSSGLSAQAQKRAPREATLEITFKSPDADLKLDVRRSVLNNYDERSFQKGYGLLMNQGTQMISHVVAVARILDGQGAELANRTYHLLSGSDPLHPGGTAPFMTIQETDARAASVHITVTEIKREAARGAVKPRPMALAWIIPRPAGVDLVVQELWTEQSRNSIDGGYFHTVDLAVTNASKAPLAPLHLQISRQDESGQVINVNEFYLSTRGSQPLYPGEVRTLHRITTVRSPVAGYSLAVTEIGVVDE